MEDDAGTKYTFNLLNKINKITEPVSFGKSTSFFVDKTTLLNDLKVIPKLNEILSALNLNTIELNNKIDKIRDPNTTRADLSTIILTISNQFYKKKGEALNKVKEMIDKDEEEDLD